jgi:hypothetical protein
VSGPESERNGVQQIRRRPEIAFWGEECLRKAFVEKKAVLHPEIRLERDFSPPGLIELVKPAVSIIAKE